MKSLRQKLLQLEGQGYKAYRLLQGTYQGTGFKLHLDHIQGDPFASPSRLRVELTHSFPPEWYGTKWRKIALEDFFAREVAKGIKKWPLVPKGSGKSGLIHIDAPGQEILPRTAVRVREKQVEVRLSVGLPAQGRKILGREAVKLLCEAVPTIVKEALVKYNPTALIKHLELVEQQQAIRRYLEEKGYVAFVANGSILPRERGGSSRPLKEGAVPFQSPPSLEVEIPVPHGAPIKGMAIPQGITLIVGGGYHGKSTLLKALERGVYNHVGGDGREFVLTHTTAVKVRAEDGRRVEKVNISPFINNLPFGKDTLRFSTQDASGSTSQAANIMEALEAGSQVLLIDEDTSATNFMIRDGRMQELVGKDKEPITPFVDKVRQLYEDYQVSTILVLGGSGDYFPVADLVIMMDEYRPLDVTEKSKKIAAQYPTLRRQEGGSSFGRFTPRIIKKESFNAFRGVREKIAVKGLHTILYGTQTIDLSYVEQLVDSSQTQAIAWMLKYIAENLADGASTLPQILDRLYEQVEKRGLEVISPYQGSHPGDLALPRRQELAAALNRLGSLQVK